MVGDRREHGRDSHDAKGTGERDECAECFERRDVATCPRNGVKPGANVFVESLIFALPARMLVKEWTACAKYDKMKRRTGEVTYRLMDCARKESKIADDQGHE
jgi:hypothetical protein